MSIENSKNLCIGCFGQLNPGNPYCPVCGYDQNTVPDTSYQLPPHTILSGKFMVGKVIGEGGFGITYIGHDINLEIKVAIKEYYPSGFVSRTTTLSTTVQPALGQQGEFFKKGRERFVDEARRLAKFSNLPGIVMVKDFFIENGTAYIVMEFVEGQTLKEYLAQMGGSLPTDRVLEMLKPVFESLAIVHEKGIIHRDISPDNLMIDHKGIVKLLDFGAAREFGDDGNKSMSVMLKHGYAPAEQYSTKGVQGAFTDVYALSATIYKAITGITPESSMDRMMDDALQPPSYLGVYIQPYQEAALMKGLAIRQEHRFQTVTELSMAFQGQMPVTAPVHHPQQYAQPMQTQMPQMQQPQYPPPPPPPPVQEAMPPQPQQPETQHTQMPTPPKEEKPHKQGKHEAIQQSEKQPKKNKKAAIVISIIAACLIIAFIPILYFTGVFVGSSGTGDSLGSGDISSPGGDTDVNPPSGDQGTPPIDNPDDDKPQPPDDGYSYDDEYIAQIDETGFLRFSYADLETWYDWQYGWSGNESALGACWIKFRVLGNYTDVKAFLISYAAPMYWEPMSIREVAAQMSEVWKSSDSLNMEARQFSGWVEQGFPINRHNLGTSGDILLLAINENIDVIGYVLIPVDAPTIDDLPFFTSPDDDVPEADVPVEPDRPNRIRP